MFCSQSLKRMLHVSVVLSIMLQPLINPKTAFTPCCFLGVSKGPPTAPEPEVDVENAPRPPSDPPGSPEPEPSDSSKPKTSRKKTKVEE